MEDQYNLIRIFASDNQGLNLKYVRIVKVVVVAERICVNEPREVVVTAANTKSARHLINSESTLCISTLSNPDSAMVPNQTPASD